MFNIKGVSMNSALLALIRKQFLAQGGRLEDFEDLVNIWEYIEYARLLIAERFGDKQLQILSDCCEFLLRNLTPLEQCKVLEEVRHRLANKKTRDNELITKWLGRLK